MLNKTIVVLLYSLIGLFVCAPVSAHEYWLQPEDFIIEPKTKMRIHIKIGQHFKGNNQPYLPDEVKSIKIHRQDKTVTVKPRLGDYPAISYAPLGDGLNIVALETHLFKLNYEYWEKFENFVESEGIDWVFAQHYKRSLPSDDFIEAYRRHAKTLLHAGSGAGQDRKVGLEFEWVLQANPYTETGELVAQLWWRGAVFADSQARLFVKSNGQVMEHILRTDQQGRVSFERLPNAVYLLNAVHMIVPDQDTVNQTDAVWESRWASITFATSK